MPDQNNAPERIWIKPCDPCENPYDYFVCDPRYLDGRETSYVKSIVSCAGCGGGLKRQSGQFVCRDCGKAETVQEVLARADRAAPEGQVWADRHQIARVIWDVMAWAAAQGAPEGSIPKYMEWGNSFGEVEARRAADRILALTPPPAAPTDNTALVEVLKDPPMVQHAIGRDTPDEDAWRELMVKAAALASREAPPAAQKPVGYRVRVKSDDPEEWEYMSTARALDFIERDNIEAQPLYAAPPPAYRQEAIEAAFKALPPDACGTIGAGEMERVLEAAFLAQFGRPLNEALNRLVSVLNQNEGKGPLPDIALMFCWMAAQDVREALRALKWDQ